MSLSMIVNSSNDGNWGLIAGNQCSLSYKRIKSGYNRMVKNSSKMQDFKKEHRIAISITKNSKIQRIEIDIQEVVEMQKKIINLDKITKLQDFKEGWNGNNGLPFECALISLFEDVISNVDKQPDIAPTGRKSLQIQYELEDKSYLGFEIFDSKITKLEVPKRQYDKAVITEKTDNYIEFINESLRGFYE